MKQRGRKSAAELSVVTSVPGQRPEPPANLTEQQAEVWRMVTSTKPHDWFTKDTHKLLVSYCKHATTAEQIDRALDNTPDSALSDAEGLKQYKELVGLREKQTRALTALSRSMRLTHQSVYRSESKKARESSDKPKPWAQNG